MSSTLTRRRVYDEVVELPPSNVTKKLSDHGILLWTTPNNRVSTSFQQETNAHTSESTFRSIRVHWDPSFCTLVNTMILYSHHTWNRRSSKIYVQYTDSCLWIVRMK